MRESWRLITLKEKSVEIRYIQPGKPNQNAHIERFNRTYQVKVLNYNLFLYLDLVIGITVEWMLVYNEQRPHDALGLVDQQSSRRELKQ
jgi:putative transposase